MRTKPCLTLEDCRKMTVACEAEAKKNKWNVTIAILDDGGHVLLLTRMDGASPVTAEIATEKGRSAAVANASARSASRVSSRTRTSRSATPVSPH